jgi:hypothetical protein
MIVIGRERGSLNWRVATRRSALNAELKAQPARLTKGSKASAPIAALLAQPECRNSHIKPLLFQRRLTAEGVGVIIEICQILNT